MPIAKRFQLPDLPDDWSQAKRTLSKTLVDFFASLQRKGALNVDPAEIAPTGTTSWNPVDASGAGLVIGVSYAPYIKYGSIVFLATQLIYPATASGAVAKIGGVPFPSSVVYLGAANGQNGSASSALVFGPNVTFNTDVGAQLTNANLSGSVIRFFITYFV